MAPILRGRRWHNDRPPRRRGPLPPEAPAMLRWFESRLDPFPPDPHAQPPASLYAFCRPYTRGAERWPLLLAVSTGLNALAEVSGPEEGRGGKEWVRTGRSRGSPGK